MSITSWVKNRGASRIADVTSSTVMKTKAFNPLKPIFLLPTLYSIFPYSFPPTLATSNHFQIHFPSTQILNHIPPQSISIIFKLQNPSQTHNLIFFEPQFSIHHSKHQRGVTMEEIFCAWIVCFLGSLWIIVDCGVICMY